MSIKKVENEPLIRNPDSEYFEFFNGDLKALKDVTKKYNLKDEESFIKFAMAVFLKADDNGIKIAQGTEYLTVLPTDDLLKQD